MSLYKVTINNWEKHNDKKKKNYRYFMFDTRFFEDQKISQLCPNDMIFFIRLLCIAGDFNSNSFTIHVGMFPKALRIGSTSLSNSLNRLQCFQLLTYENVLPNKIKEKKIKEIKEIKLQGGEEISKSKDDKEENKRIWETYFNAYRLRYGIDPVRNAQVNSQVKQLRTKLGTEDAIRVVQFYLSHNDSWYLKQTHSFGLCLKDAETLRTQMLRGKAITQNDVRRFESADKINQMLDEAKKGGF